MWLSSWNFPPLQAGKLIVIKCLKWDFVISFMDLGSDQPRLWQCWNRRVSSYTYECDPCNPYFPKPMRCAASGTCQCHYSLSYVMLRPRLFSGQNMLRLVPSWLHAQLSSSFNRILNISCQACSSMPVPHSFWKCIWLNTTSTADAQAFQ